MGGRNEIYIGLLHDNLYALVFLVFSLLTSGVLLTVAARLCNKLAGSVRSGLLHLGLFILITCVWVVTDSDLMLFVTGHVEAVALVRFHSNPLANYAYFYCIGIILFVISLVNATFVSLYEQMKENANMAAYKRLAYMDAMTGMANRAAFMEAQRQNEAASGLACIVFDSNNLKWINDQYGHPEGGHAITAAARLIRDTFGDGGTCFRIGGDEFLVFLKGGSADQIAAELERLNGKFAAETRASGSRFDIAAGYAVRREGGKVQA